MSRHHRRTLPLPDAAQRAATLLQGLHEDEDGAWDTIMFAIASGTDPALLEALDATQDPTWQVVSGALGHVSEEEMVRRMFAMLADRLRTLTQEQEAGR